MLEIHDDEIFTQVIHFEVDPGKQAALIDAIASEVERWVRHRRGFVSSALHASHDGKRSETDFCGFTNDPETKQLGMVIRAIGPVKGPDATSYRIAHTVGPA